MRAWLVRMALVGSLVPGLNEGPLAATSSFVFAFSPQSGQEIENLGVSPYQLLILPAAKVRADSLAIHDGYWNERSKGMADAVARRGKTGSSI